MDVFSFGVGVGGKYLGTSLDPPRGAVWKVMAI